MPPKKRTAKPVKNAKPKLEPSGRKKKITIRNPPSTTVELRKKPATNTNNAKPRSPNVKKEIQIMLANEVVALHFAKKPTTTSSPCAPPPARRRYVRKKLLNTENAGQQPATTATTPPPAGPPRKRKLLRKRSRGSEDSNKGSVKAVKRRSATEALSNKNEADNKIRVHSVGTVPQPSSGRGSGPDEDETVVASVMQALNKERQPTSRNVKMAKNKESFNFVINIGSDGAPASDCASDCMSWTRDISSTSTTTTTCITVSTDEFVRFDNKLPIVKLTDVNDMFNLPSCTSAANRHEDAALSTISPSRSLKLSASSASSRQGPVDEIAEALNKLMTDFKEFDVEMMDWIGYKNEDDEPAARGARNPACAALLLESAAVAHCRRIQSILSRGHELPRLGGEDNIPGGEDNNTAAEDFVQPRAISRPCTGNTESDLARRTPGDKEGKDPPEDAGRGCDVAADERSNEDEDALSLFAESLASLESLRRSEPPPRPRPPHLAIPDEYVPQPININKKCSQTVTYFPSQIDKRNENKVVARREWKINSKGIEKISISRATDGAPRAPPSPSCPMFIAADYVPTRWYQSAVFKGVCFFNLVSSCNKARCAFLHEDLDLGTVESKLTKLSEIIFIKEYMLVRNTPRLRRKYGSLFVAECVRRELTSVALEMAVDFTMAADCGHQVKREVLETILLYLNGVDIFPLRGYLTFPLKGKSLLCDVFLEALATTQNFCRFKPIFIYLINFIDQIPLQINFEVANSLVERVSILPYEEKTARALLIVMKRTTPGIAQNSMLSLLEQRLAADNLALFDELQAVKRQLLSAADVPRGAGPPRRGGAPAPVTFRYPRPVQSPVTSPGHKPIVRSSHLTFNC